MDLDKQIHKRVEWNNYKVLGVVLEMKIALLQIVNLIQVSIKQKQARVYSNHLGIYQLLERKLNLQIVVLQIKWKHLKKIIYQRNPVSK